MIAVSNDFKTAMKQPIKEIDAYIEIAVNDKITSADDLIQIKISCDTGLCKTAMRKLEAKYLGDRNLLGKWVHVGYGVRLANSTFEYLDYGSFLITEITYSKDTETTTIVGYDKMINSMVGYSTIDLEYPIGLYEYTRLLCLECNLELGNIAFGKNLLPNNKTSGVNRGITFTSNEDGTYLINGTSNSSTTNSVLYIYTGELDIPAGTYYYIPTGDSNCGVSLKATYTDNTTKYFDLYTGTSIVIPKDIKRIDVYLQVRKGTTTTYDNFKIYPMLSTTPVTISNYKEYNQMNNWQITKELWENIEGITYRDILQQIAQATSSTAMISNDDKIYFKPLTDTGEELTYDDMKTLKLEPLYGEINSVVLSRTPQEDNIYMRDDQSIEDNGLTEWRIENNEIIDKDRDNAMTPIYNAMHGISYYPFEINTIGLAWFEIADNFDIVNDSNETFNTSLFNFNITIDGAITETLKTTADSKTQTQYQYATTIGKRVKNTEIIVDKQEQEITLLSSDIDEHSERISTIEQTVDEIEQSIEDIEDLTRDVTGYGLIHLENTYPSDLLYFKLDGPFSLIYPQDSLYPSNDLYPVDSYLIIDKTEELSQDAIKVHLPVSYLKANESFIIENGNCRIEHSNNTIEELGEINIPLFEGDNYIYLESFVNENIKISGKYAIKSDYTDIFATKIEMNSSITQTKDEINLEVSRKVDEDEVVSTINQSAEKITLRSNRIEIDSDYFTLTEDGQITATSGDIGGFLTTSTSFSKALNGLYNYSYFDATLVAMIIMNRISADTNLTNILDVNNSGSILSSDYVLIKNILSGQTQNTKEVSGSVEINSDDPKNCLVVKDENNNIVSSIGVGGINSTYIITDNLICGKTGTSYNDFTGATINGNTGNITCVSLTQTSLVERKKNIKKLTNAKEILKATDIYKYNFKEENDTDKKSIGFVIGDNYNYSEEITSKNNDGAEIYSMVSVLWQVVKEQQTTIEDLQKRIEVLEDGNNSKNND